MPKEISTEIIIPASPDAVWAILTDFTSYPDWNPFVRSIKGEQRKGAVLDVMITPPNTKAQRFRPEITVWEPSQHFEWLGKLGFTFLFSGRHQFILTTHPEGTQLIHREEFSGLLASPLLYFIAKNTRRGFELMNEALSERVQERTPTA